LLVIGFLFAGTFGGLATIAAIAFATAGDLSADVAMQDQQFTDLQTGYGLA
jgi:hypothetical protein